MKFEITFRQAGERCSKISNVIEAGTPASLGYALGHELSALPFEWLRGKEIVLRQMSEEKAEEPHRYPKP